ncbi:MAG: GNAT family N-acetyltransferase [Chloroflexi bacterium]|nr:GNAT family N-acetyltransferase [Chloroflexota bacterium]
MTIRRIDLSSLEAQRAWDARAVDAPGGDVHQGSAWLTYRASLGREAIALEADDAPLGILLNRAPLFGLPKGHAPRGPLAPWGATVAQVVAVAERIQRVATWLGAEYGLVALDADPWLPAGEATESAFRNAGLQETDEIFPSQHTMVLRASATGTSEADLFEGITKSTRQRITLAERAGFVAERITHLTPATERTALWDQVQLLLEATAQRKSFALGSSASMIRWWDQLVATERAELLTVRDTAGALVAFIVILRHGERITTDASGDDPIARRETPGALALLRWTAIKIAVGERRITDLGGVDVAGHRDVPIEGDAMHGLYAHKASFGAVWTPMAGAHRAVLRPRALRLRSLLGRVRGGR